jgi:hypothetical protein
VGGVPAQADPGISGEGLFSEDESESDEEEEAAEGAFEVGGGDVGGEPGAEVSAGDGERGDGDCDTPIDIPEVGMFPGAGDRGGDDDEERGSDGLVDIAYRGAEEQHHGWDHDNATPDTKESAGHSADESDEARDEIVHERVMGWTAASGQWFFARAGWWGNGTGLPRWGRPDSP